MKKTILAIIASGIAISIASCGGQKAGAENSSAENDSLGRSSDSVLHQGHHPEISCASMSSRRPAEACRR